MRNILKQCLSVPNMGNTTYRYGHVVRTCERKELHQLRKYRIVVETLVSLVNFQKSLIQATAVNEILLQTAMQGMQSEL